MYYGSQMFVGVQIKTNMTKTEKWDTKLLEYSLICCNLFVATYALYYIIVPLVSINIRKIQTKLSEQKKRKSKTKTVPFSKDSAVAHFTRTGAAAMPIYNKEDQSNEPKLSSLQGVRKTFGAGSEEYQMALTKC